MASAQHRWPQFQQFYGGWENGDSSEGAEDQTSESENYFPEPMGSGQRTRLPDISGSHQPIGIHLGSKRGRLVTFYRNGDAHFKGLSASISQKAFVSMESLLMWLNEKIPTTAGVRHIFRLPDGRRLREVSEFQPGGHYVVSSVRRLVRGPDYGGTFGPAVGAGTEVVGSDLQQLQRPPLTSVAGHMRQSDIRLLAKGEQQNGGGGQMHQRRGKFSSSFDGGFSMGGPGGRGVRLITVVSNTHRNSREKVLVNPGTRLNFEDLLADFTSLLVMSGPPVRSLYTAIPPYRKVESFSQLFREFRDHDIFIACGRELTPVELTVGVRRDTDGGGHTSVATTIDKSTVKQQQQQQQQQQQPVQLLVHKPVTPTQQKQAAQQYNSVRAEDDWHQKYNKNHQ